jgi:hypothetical protein
VHADAVPPSSLHRNVAVPSVSVNEKLAEALFEGSLGAEVMVGAGGGVPSTVTVGCGPWSVNGFESVRSDVVHS